MAKKVTNDKGFLVIEISAREALDKCGFGYHSLDYSELICDICNKWLEDSNKLFYVAVLNEVICEDCYIDWVANATRYEEDIDFETEMYNKYAAILNLDTDETN